MLGFLANDRFDQRLHHGGPKKKFVRRLYQRQQRHSPSIQFVPAPPPLSSVSRSKWQDTPASKVHMPPPVQKQPPPLAKTDENPVWVVVLHTLWAIFQKHQEQCSERMALVEKKQAVVEAWGSTWQQQQHKTTALHQQVAQWQKEMTWLFAQVQVPKIGLRDRPRLEATVLYTLSQSDKVIVFYPLKQTSEGRWWCIRTTIQPEKRFWIPELQNGQSVLGPPYFI